MLLDMLTLPTSQVQLPPTPNALDRPEAYPQVSVCVCGMWESGQGAK